ncbi:hypothetical protein IG631_15276 [Alternaria alternata]|nr:hypothetical protein IG631_15276 [Alternaria alternata]
MAFSLQDNGVLTRDLRVMHGRFARYPRFSAGPFCCCSGNDSFTTYIDQRALDEQQGDGVRHARHSYQVPTDTPGCSAENTSRLSRVRANKAPGLCSAWCPSVLCKHHLLWARQLPVPLNLWRGVSRDYEEVICLQHML